MKATAILRNLLVEGEPIVAPGAYDGLTARLIEAAGFPAVYMTGAGVSAARGYPDYGLLTLTEMANTAGTLSKSVRLPVISDADTGYGNELNVTRTMHEFENRGVAGIHIEDQVAPKRCGHIAGKEIVTLEEYCSKIRAAVAARRDPDFVVIARTDARSVSGFEDAVARANAALKAGADLAFVEAVETTEEVRAVPRLVNGPCVLNNVPGGKTPSLSTKDAKALGYKLIIHPGIALFSMISAFDTALEELRTLGTSTPPPGIHPTDLFRRMGAAEWDAIRNASVMTS